MKNEKGTIVLAGGVIGLIAAILVFFGNPANMGFCIACFLRDTTGALGLHSAAAVRVYPPGDHWSGAWSMYHFTC